MTKLLQFVTSLTNDPIKRHAFKTDREAVLKNADVSDDDRTLLRSNDFDGIGRAIELECRRFITSGRGPWPSSTVEIIKIEPQQGALGSRVTVTIEGNFLGPDTICSLQLGQESLVGEVKSLRDGGNAMIEVTFDLSQTTISGAWDVKVANDDAHYDVWSASFETTAPVLP